MRSSRSTCRPCAAGGAAPKAAAKGPAQQPKQTPEEKAAAQAAKDAEKLRAKIIKEGGKKGVEIEGASDMGGLDFFCTTMELPEGNLEYLELSMLAMNAEPDPEAEDRKGCSGHIGKMIYSAGVEQLVAEAIAVKPTQLSQMSAAAGAIDSRLSQMNAAQVDVSVVAPESMEMKRMSKPEPEPEANSSEKMSKLTSMGFSRDEATRALAAKGGDVEAALDMLLTGGLGS